MLTHTCIHIATQPQPHAQPHPHQHNTRMNTSSAVSVSVQSKQRVHVCMHVCMCMCHTVFLFEGDPFLSPATGNNAAAVSAMVSDGLVKSVEPQQTTPIWGAATNKPDKQCVQHTQDTRQKTEEKQRGSEKAQTPLPSNYYCGRCP